jgi:hypothetical protein
VVALKQLIGTKVKSDQIERMGITEGIKETVNKTNDDEATVENEQSE